MKSNSAPTPAATLRKLFLTLFLRGSSFQRGQPEKLPKSIGRKLLATLALHALFGCLVLFFHDQSVFMRSVWLHSMTFVFLGMTLASSAGEMLFNKQEADTLLHRPIQPRDLLWAKMRVLVEVAWWLAIAFNLAGLFTGFVEGPANLGYLLVHGISVTLQSLFCTGCVVLMYQLCLRWFGRERLDALMTTAQVTLSVGAMLAGQTLPRLLSQSTIAQWQTIPWWIGLLPPAWFAGFDDAFAGSHALSSWLLAACAVGGTGIVMWLTVGALAGQYVAGWQMLNESTPSRGARQRRRPLDALANSWPLRRSWRNPIERAAFVLCLAYLWRNREIKLRTYPAMAPILGMPLVMLISSTGRAQVANFALAFAGSYLCVAPMMMLEILQYSSDWSAADVFRLAPLIGPGSIHHGARRALILVVLVPSYLVWAIIGWSITREVSSLALLLPGLIAAPIFALLPQFIGYSPILSAPVDAAKGARRGSWSVVLTLAAMSLTGVSLGLQFARLLGWFVLVELVCCLIAYRMLHTRVTTARWPVAS